MGEESRQSISSDTATLHTGREERRRREEKRREEKRRRGGCASAGAGPQTSVSETSLPQHT